MTKMPEPDPMTEEKITALEERIAHLSVTVEELSDVVAGQANEIALLTNRVRMLVEREAEREVAEGSGVPLADQRPPHW
ncbi:SlyX family protein [Actibacterium pelagium]|uniref:SlyX protein n=1 Tax=Actibacterium pelagium TaxID=2029103 RepID=A0A917EGS6_9RHOB|nr:SlyX family protein [Actibacterium pelagium]GGE37770.1 slyX protein [Actibacterium pelagium]